MNFHTNTTNIHEAYPAIMRIKHAGNKKIGISSVALRQAEQTNTFSPAFGNELQYIYN